MVRTGGQRRAILDERARPRHTKTLGSSQQSSLSLQVAPSLPHGPVEQAETPDKVTDAASRMASRNRRITVHLQFTEGDVFCYGRVHASIGPALPDEPQHYVAGRRLTSNYLTNAWPGAPKMYAQGAPAIVRPQADGRAVLTMDLSNSLPIVLSTI